MIQCSRTVLTVIDVTQVRVSQLCVCALSLHVFTRGHSSWQYLKNIVAELHPATSYTNIIMYVGSIHIIIFLLFTTPFPPFTIPQVHKHCREVMWASYKDSIVYMMDALLVLFESYFSSLFLFMCVVCVSVCVIEVECVWATSVNRTRSWEGSGVSKGEAFSLHKRLLYFQGSAYYGWGDVRGGHVQFSVRWRRCRQGWRPQRALARHCVIVVNHTCPHTTIWVRRFSF